MIDCIFFSRASMHTSIWMCVYVHMWATTACHIVAVASLKRRQSLMCTAVATCAFKLHKQARKKRNFIFFIVCVCIFVFVCYCTRVGQNVFVENSYIFIIKNAQQYERNSTENVSWHLVRHKKKKTRSNNKNNKKLNVERQFKWLRVHACLQEDTSACDRPLNWPFSFH